MDVFTEQIKSMHPQDAYPGRGLQRQQQRAGADQDPREERHRRGEGTVIPYSP